MSYCAISYCTQKVHNNRTSCAECDVKMHREKLYGRNDSGFAYCATKWCKEKVLVNGWKCILCKIKENCRNTGCRGVADDSGFCQICSTKQVKNETKNLFNFCRVKGCDYNCAQNMKLCPQHNSIFRLCENNRICGNITMHDKTLCYNCRPL